MHQSLTKIDKLIVYKNAAIKLCRGFFASIFIKGGKMLFVGRNVQITHGNHIRCGKYVKFEDYAEIHGLATEGLNFGDYVTIGRDVMIRPSSYYGGDMGIGLTMGEHSSIGPHGYVGCSGKITIGANVMIGPKCSLFAENHIFSDGEHTIKSQGVKQVGITIEDDCWIGSNVIILDGVTIGKGSVIGGGTLISKDVPPYSLVIDERTKRIRNREEKKE